MGMFYFRRKDGGEVRRKDYDLLCIRFACETFGCPIFGPVNDFAFEFDESDVNLARKGILEQVGYVETSRPSWEERGLSARIAQAFTFVDSGIELD